MVRHIVNMKSPTVNDADYVEGAKSRTSLPITVADIAFLVFLLLVFVGLQPFAARDIALLQRAVTGEGDLLRQATYLTLFAIVVALIARRLGHQALKVIPISVLAALAWSIASVAWSIAPEITLRRAGLNAIITLTVFFCIYLVGRERGVRIVGGVLAGVLVVNLLSVLFLPQAIHRVGEADAALVGNWRGLFFHKNIAGPTTALSVLFFLHGALARGRLSWALVAGGVAFTVGTASKTAILLLLPAAAGLVLFHWVQQYPARRRAFALALLVATVLGIVAAALFNEQVAELLSDRTTFTGRGAIWQVVAAYITEHPVLGSGFGAFWQSGNVSPVIALAREGWLLTVAHSHNGYLEMLVTTGFSGFFICLAAFIIVPINRVLSNASSIAPLVFSLLIFCVGLNATETALMERDRPEWVVFVIAVALLVQYPSQRVRGGGF